MQINAMPQPMILTTQNQQVSKTENDSSFGDMLNEALDKVNEAQLHADEMKIKFVTGQVEDIHQVTIAGEEANIAINLAVEVRNKILEAYQEISRMPL